MIPKCDVMSTNYENRIIEFAGIMPVKAKFDKVADVLARLLMQLSQMGSVQTANANISHIARLAWHADPSKYSKHPFRNIV